MDKRNGGRNVDEQAWVYSVEGLTPSAGAAQKLSTN